MVGVQLANQGHHCMGATVVARRYDNDDTWSWEGGPGGAPAQVPAPAPAPAPGDAWVWHYDRQSQSYTGVSRVPGGPPPPPPLVQPAQWPAPAPAPAGRRSEWPSADWQGDDRQAWSEDDRGWQRWQGDRGREERPGWRRSSAWGPGRGRWEAAPSDSAWLFYTSDAAHEPTRRGFGGPWLCLDGVAVMCCAGLCSNVVCH